ncbi:GGDEF domain-containing protein [Zavarzinia sp. CC-PAN008]|uniref:GGDEF domain-containing protein n=1 Tax=Zavarzinia sp. CC-PAN008 TaxID=3243332 RepID=UPI003F746FAB
MSTSQALWLMVGQFQLLLACGWAGALRWSTAESRLALRSLAGFNALCGVGMALISQRGTLDHGLTTIGSDLCVAVAFILLWRAGEAHFTRGHVVNGPAQGVALAVVSLAILWFGQAPEDARYRVMALYLMIVGVCAWNAWRGCRILWAKGDRRVSFAIAFTAMLISTGLLWRGVTGLHDWQPAQVEVDTLFNHLLAHVVLLAIVLVNVVFVYFFMARIVRRLHRLSRRDTLTGLLNRRALFEALEREWARSTRTAAPLCVVCLDIDHFKAINDAHGHPMGDAVLARLGRVLVETLRGSDIVGRTGGEEFIALLLDTDAAGAQQIAERLRQAVAQDMVLRPAPAERVTISAGIAARGEDDAAAEHLVARADAALYAAKAAGRNRVVLAGPGRVRAAASPPLVLGAG